MSIFDSLSNLKKETQNSADFGELIPVMHNYSDIPEALKQNALPAGKCFTQPDWVGPPSDTEGANKSAPPQIAHQPGWDNCPGKNQPPIKQQQDE